MKSPTPEQFAKLPKWAQQHIRLLEMRLKEAQEDARKNAGPENSRVTIGWEPSFKVRDDHPFRFSLGDDSMNHVQVSFHHGGLQIMGGRSIVVLPSASNVIHVFLRRS